MDVGDYSERRDIFLIIKAKLLAKNICNLCHFVTRTSFIRSQYQTTDLYSHSFSLSRRLHDGVLAGFF